MPRRILAGAFAACLLLSGGGISAYAQNTRTATQQSGICVGKIFDQNGEPVVGAAVKVAGSPTGAISDINGSFSLAGVKKGDKVEVSALGYSPASKVWDGSEELYFTLTEEANALNELVVVGYGTQKKANLTGAVSSVNASQIEDRAVSSVSTALAGQMPGVVVVQSSGAPGGQTGAITIRGNNTINSASPLVIVDGVPGSMNNIDPQDIESVSVLKDAASAAIYGVQAANGVILITTKKGKLNTAATVQYSGSVSWVRPTTHLHKVNAQQHDMLYREAMLNVNPSADVSAFDARLQQYANGQLDPAGFDWYGQTFKGSATETQHTVQVSGGSANTTYMASLGYVYQGGLLDQINYNRYNGRMNLDSKIKPWVAFGMQASYYRGIQKDGYTGFNSIMQHCNRLNATMQGFDKEGNYLAPNGFQNPIAESDYRTGHQRTTDDQLSTNLYLNITPIEGLVIRPLFSWRHDYRETYNYKKILYYDGTYNNGDNGTRAGSHNYYNWDWYTYQVTVNYNKTIGVHSFGILGGYEGQKYTYHYTTASRSGGGDNDLTGVLNTLDTGAWKNDDNAVGLNRRSWFGRLTYDFAGRYLLEANLRADASSRFPKENRWGYFPAVSAGWRFSSEAFMEGASSWLSNGKIRLGWGRTGNEEITDYYPGVATYGYTDPVINGTKFMSLYPVSANTNLKWATVTNMEIGLDLGLLNNRITFEGSVYHRKTSDMLLTLPVLGALGIDAPPQNAGEVVNKGIDITAAYRDRAGDWTYGVTVNVGYNHNEITELAGQDGENPDNKKTWFLTGKPIGSYYGYLCDGIFKNEAEVKAGPLRTGRELPGNLRYKDLDGDGKITPEDRTVIGKMNPSWMGGVNIDAGWKGFDLSMLWQGAFDFNRYMDGEASQAFYNNGTALDWQLDRWTPENPNGNYPRLYPNASDSPDVNNNNSFWCEDASYVRLKNLTIGYTMPVALTERLGINKVRLFLTGENLLTFSKLYDKDIDPEAPQGRGAFYSNVKKLSLGLKITF